MKKLLNKLMIALTLVSFFTIFNDTVDAQLKLRYPRNVRYIGGGFQDKSPYFSNLEAALNNVLPYATVGNPYIFDVQSDSLWISDWDSVVNTGTGITMKDSIDVYYVQTGKIKWAGYGFGGTGTGGGVIPVQTEHTTYYDMPIHEEGLAEWLDSLTTAFNITDEVLYSLIVYTLTPLYIENDTLKVNVDNIVTSVIESLELSGDIGWNPDTTTVLRTTGVQSAQYLSIDSLLFNADGTIMLPTFHAEYVSGKVRGLAGNASWLLYDGQGDGTPDSMATLTYIRAQGFADSTRMNNLIGDSLDVARILWRSEISDTANILRAAWLVSIKDTANTLRSALVDTASAIRSELLASWALDIMDSLNTFEASNRHFAAAMLIDGILTSESLTTDAPTAGSAVPWKFGEVSATTLTVPDKTLRIQVNGTVYFIPAKLTND